MADKPRTRRPTEDEIKGYLLDHPDAMGAQLQKAFPGLLLTEAREWVSKIRAQWAQDPKAIPSLRSPPEAPAKEPAPKAVPTGVTPAERLTDEDRKTLGGAVRDLHKLIRIHAARLLKEAERMEEDPSVGVGLDKDEAQALANYSKIAATLVDTYPGLISMEELSSNGQPVQNVTESDRSIVDEVLKRKQKEA